MPEFRINEPITTEQPDIEVTVTAQAPLAVGRHIFRLIVADDSENLSAPDDIEVIVLDSEAPTAVLEGPRTVGFGQTFNLSGRRSTDVGGGRIVRFTWMRVG
jgi:hypothetical protein